MSRLLADLLGADQLEFSNMLARMETDSGSPNVDVRLVTEIATKVRAKLKELGLDPNDTNGRELYHGLQTLIKKHDEFLAKAIGASDPTNADDLLPRIIAKIDSLDIPKTCWAIKHSSAKRLLKLSPPKKLMKLLNYRSIDSMLKREGMDEVYAALRFSESPTWLKRFIATYKKLSPGDFENREVKVVSLSEKRYGELAKDFAARQASNVIALKDVGTVAILPSPFENLPGLTITVFPLLLHAINEVRVHSAYLKLQQVKPHFAELLIDELNNHQSGEFEISGQSISWQVLARYYGKPSSKGVNVFEPNLQVEDLLVRTADEVLYKIEPALKFWDGLDYIAVMADGRPVPLGLSDNAISYCNNLDYGQQATSHFRQNLWDELMSRYVGQQPIEEKLLKQLDSDGGHFDLSLADIGSMA